MKTSTLHQALALLGMVALVPLAIAASRGTPRPGANADLRWAQQVEAGEDHIGAKDLAQRMLAGDPSLLLACDLPLPAANPNS